jgi:hypothetical protein
VLRGDAQIAESRAEESDLRERLGPVSSEQAK